MKKTILSKCFLHSVLLTLAFCLLPVLPALAQGDIVDRLDKALGVTLPSEYKSKVKEFVKTNSVLKDEGTATFTQQFIEEEMKTDWGIDRQNQLLFIWHSIYSRITEKPLYDEKDGNSKRLEDFNSKVANMRTRISGQKYQNKVLAYMNQRIDEYEQQSAEAKKRSAEAEKRSAEAEQRSAEAEKRSAEYERQSDEAKKRSAEARQHSIMVIYCGLYETMGCYQHRGSAFESEIKMMKELGEKWIRYCEKFNIDYRSLFPLEVQKYFDIQPTKQNNLTCEQASVQILTCALKELAKLYNLYQQAPQAEREIDKEQPSSLIKRCKENNLDYKAILLKELGDRKKVDDLLKFFEVE